MTANVPRTRSRETRLLLLGFALVALLRLLTLAPDPWEWDEVLFLQAARDGLDVRLSHPHAPGYPGFVYPARALVHLGVPPFAAVTAVGYVGGLLSVLGLYALARAFGSERRFAGIGAAVFALIPAVWLHSVRPLTDAPGVAFFLLSAALLVRAIRGGAGRDLVASAALSALAAAIRPHAGLALLPLAALAAGAVLWKTRKPVFLAAAVGAGLLLTALFWAPAVRSSGGLEAYGARLAGQLADVRSFDRPQADDLTRGDFWRRWLVDPFGTPVAALPLGALAAAGLLDRRRSAAAVALFLPAFAVSVLSLDVRVAPRYALAYLPLAGLLAGFGCERLARTRVGRGAVPAAALALACTVVPAIPAIAEVHDRTSPPVAAMHALRTAPQFAAGVVHVHPALVVHAREMLRGRAIHQVDEDRPLAPPAPDVIAWTEAPVIGRPAAAAWRFATSLTLERISRGRYLEVALYEAASGAAYDVPRVEGAGWWDGSKAGLRPGGSLSLTSASPSARVGCLVDTEDGVQLAVETAGGRTLHRFGPGVHPLELVAAATGEASLLRVAVLEGRTELRSFRIDTTAAAPRPAAFSASAAARGPTGR